MLKNKKLKIKKYLDVINKIEKARARNNINWMDILRLAIKSSPDEAMKILKRINKKDQNISDLFSKIK
jgi:hypothetical protein|tara:strand:+ start:154 stop:357 length:204 start_codon:yes stop_codon:yes gene_type:complete